MKSRLFISLSLIFYVLPLSAAKPKVDSVLFAYYTRCKDNIEHYDVLETADTLFQLSSEKGDVRMQAAALSLKADHYYFTNQLDSLRAWLPRIYEFTRRNDQIRYYFFTWNRLITYHIKASQYTFAQYELNKMLREAEKENYKAGTAEAYTQLGHIFATKGIDSLAAVYYTKAVDYIAENNLVNFNMSTSYIRMALVWINLEQFDKARKAIDLAEKYISIPDQLWSVKRTRSLLYAYTNENTKALALLRDIERNGREKIAPADFYGLQYSVYNALGMYDKAIVALEQQADTYKALGYAENYDLHNLRKRSLHFARKGDYQQAYEALSHFSSVYKKRVQEENSEALNEFATLLNLNQLNEEKAALEKTAQEERYRRSLFLIIGLSLALLLTAIFIAILVRLNQRLNRAKREAEKASHIKSLFIQHITHELNTPLNAVLGFSELAALEGNSDVRNEYIEIIHTNCEYLQRLVENALYVSDFESSEQSPFLEQTDINECCRHSLERIRRALPQQIELRFHPSCSELTVSTCQSYVQQILTNLLRNAVQFTTQGSIELAYTYDEAAKQLTFTVTDTGCGIPVEKSELIFERFSKLDKFTIGSGLGLSVCRLAARRLGGEVKLDTTHKTGGARFIFTLPISHIKH